MRTFDIPTFFKSPLIAKVKNFQKAQDPKKRDFAPCKVDLGAYQLVLARHFGFCFGVENAIELAYKALNDNPGKRIFLLSQMIHNQDVNQDLQENGIQFLMDTSGNRLMDWNSLTPEDVVLIPAFGTTIDIQQELEDKGLQLEKYNTTCPFVERVWKKSEKLGKDNHTIIIHGKPQHEETRATFSHSSASGPSIVIKNLEEAKEIGAYIAGEKPWNAALFNDRHTPGFNPETDLDKIGIVNQTTMLAEDTAEIVDYFREVKREQVGEEKLKQHFAETRDTLCYATNDNQSATKSLLKVKADLAVVVGGYNSSNTSHLVELLEGEFPTLFVKNETEMVSAQEINHFDFRNKSMLKSALNLPDNPTIIVTSGASCPDSSLERVIHRLHSLIGQSDMPDEKELKIELIQD